MLHDLEMIHRRNQGRRYGRAMAIAVLLTITALNVLHGPPEASALGITTSCTLQSLDNPSEAGSPARFRFFANNVGSRPGPVGAVTFFDGGSPRLRHR